MSAQARTGSGLPERTVLIAFGLFSLSAGVCSAEEYPTSGVSPSERPAGAPVITEYIRGEQWYARALTGLTPPYPDSLRFLEAQGGWYTPFTQPGMPGYYDLRGWHAGAR